MQNDPWDMDTAQEIKVIKFLIYSQKDNLALVDYLSSISDLIFSTHTSEMRYNETYYFRGIGKNVKATIVPTITLSVIPRKYRKPHWFYVAIYCHPNDQRFDTFPGYETILATQYDL
jgi:hypothetical protein